MRGDNGTLSFFNTFNVASENRINQATHESEHASSSWFNLSGLYTIKDRNEYIDDAGISGAHSSIQVGRWKVIRNAQWAKNAAADCGLGTVYYDDNTPYNTSSDVYFEGNASCNNANSFNYNTPPLTSPDAPVR